MNLHVLVPALVFVHETPTITTRLFSRGLSTDLLAPLTAPEPVGPPSTVGSALTAAGAGLLLIIPAVLVLKEFIVHAALGWPLFTDNLTMVCMLGAFVASGALLLTGAAVSGIAGHRARRRWADGIRDAWRRVGYALLVPDETVFKLGDRLNACAAVLNTARLTAAESATARTVYGRAVNAISNYLVLPPPSAHGRRMAISARLEDPAVQKLVLQHLKTEQRRCAARDAANLAVAAVEELAAHSWHAASDRDTITLAHRILEDSLV